MPSVQGGRILVGVTKYTSAKDYILPQFYEMMAECIEPIVGKENIIVVGDHQDEIYHTEIRHVDSSYAEDFLIDSREYIRKLAVAEEYDYMMWQGLDALFQSREDFIALLSNKVDIVAPLICSREDSNNAIARRFIYKDDQLTTKQEDIGDEELYEGEFELSKEMQAISTYRPAGGFSRRAPWLVEAGFPGADNIIIHKDCYHIPFAEGHTPWYDRVEAGQDNVCVEEEWIRRALVAGKKSYVDTSVKVWHCHEDGIARMFKGIQIPTSELRWG